MADMLASLLLLWEEDTCILLGSRHPLGGPGWQVESGVRWRGKAGWGQGRGLAFDSGAREGRTRLRGVHGPGGEQDLEC